MALKRIYLDNNATTQPAPEVVEAMLLYLYEKFGNPSSKSHYFGWEAESAVENSRTILANFINADKKEIVFTSCATESINTVHNGISESYSFKGNHIISSQVDHHASLDSLANLENKGIEVTYLPVDRYGLVDSYELEKAIKPNTILVSIIYANNEIGSLNNIKEIGQICRNRNVLFHTDAVQALGKIKFDVQEQFVDLASFSGHKLHGPKGVGALYIKNKVKLKPLLFGGGQENNLRSGTLNVPGIVGFGKAVELANNNMDEDAKRISFLRDLLYLELKNQIEGITLNGHPENRLPGNLNISIDGVKADNLIAEIKNIAFSTSSACTSSKAKVSHVLKAIKLEENLLSSTIRFGLSRYTTKEEILETIKIFSEKIQYLRSISPLTLING
ncbi:MAG TPA: cysteine desulfurase family protein [Ignavibacteriaceae bacterium]|nr:cysteine desulfurase family protein [Ignavibacteriaceae bacterium]